MVEYIQYHPLQVDSSTTVKLGVSPGNISNQPAQSSRKNQQHECSHPKWICSSPTGIFVCHHASKAKKNTLTHRIHGAGIYANIWGILMGSMLPYIAAPWIRWVSKTWRGPTTIFQQPDYPVAIGSIHFGALGEILTWHIESLNHLA